MTVPALVVALLLAAPGAPNIRGVIGQTISPTGSTGGVVDDRVNPLLHVPFLTTGPLIEEDANTVAHVYWNGTTLVDTKANVWTEAGTVTYEDAPLYPSGFSSAAKRAAVFGGSGVSFAHSGALASASVGFTACVVARKKANGSNEFVYQESGASSSGFRVMQYAAGSTELVSLTSGCSTSVTAAAGDTSQYRMICFGRNGDAGYVNVNGTSNSDATCSALSTAAAPTDAAYIGNSSVGTSPALSGIAEVYVTNTPYNATTVAGIMARFFGQVTSTGTPLTVTRTSSATYDVGGTLWTAPAGAIRVNSDGALIEASATNYALNSGTHPKTTEASASVTTGAAVAWHAGTGTMTLAAGTATVTGLSCTAVAAGTPCTFTVTVAGTMSITTTAGTTRVQIEKGSAPTSYISTAGTSATRQADAVSVANPFDATDPTSFCVGATATPYGSRTWSKIGALLSTGTDAAANAWSLRLDASANVVFDADQKIGTWASGYTTGAHMLRAGTAAGVLSMYADGAVVAPTISGAGDGVVGTQAASLRLGAGSAASTEWNGYLQDVKLYNVPCAKAR